MATVKKVKKAQGGCEGGGCMKSAEGMFRREVRQERSMAGERLDQKLMRALGLATREGQERRQADRWARKDDRRDRREYRRDQRRSSGGYFGGGFGSGGFKKGGKLKKAQNGIRAKQQDRGFELEQSKFNYDKLRDEALRKERAQVSPKSNVGPEPDKKRLEKLRLLPSPMRKSTSDSVSFRRKAGSVAKPMKSPTPMRKPMKKGGVIKKSTAVRKTSKKK